MQNYTRLFCIPIFSATLAPEPHSLRRSPARQPYNQMDGLLPLRSHPACCLLGRFFLTYFSPASFFLTSVPLSKNYVGWALWLCGHGLNRFVATPSHRFIGPLSPLSSRSLPLSHRSLTVTCIFCAASITTKWKRQSLNRCDMKSAGIRHESGPACYPAECCPTGDP